MLQRIPTSIPLKRRQLNKTTLRVVLLMVKTAGSYLSELRRAPVYNLVIDRTEHSNVSVGPEYSNNIFAKIFETPGVCTIVLLAD